MAAATPPANLLGLRLWRKDLGVALVVLVALASALGLRTMVTTRTTPFRHAETQFEMAYPADWTRAEAEGNTILALIDLRAASQFKSMLSVEARGLDPANPPTLQTLVDQRVQERGSLTAYHLLATTPAPVGGARAMRLEYAYVEQPIDTPLRAALPVVVHAVEYLVPARDNVFYLSLTASESEFDRARAWLDRILETVKFP